MGRDMLIGHPIAIGVGLLVVLTLALMATWVTMKLLYRQGSFRQESRWPVGVAVGMTFLVIFCVAAWYLV